mgnify:CR=1 FL=1
MSHSVLYIPSAFGERPKSATTEKADLKLAKSDFLWPAIFMVCLSLTGLHIYPAILVCLAVMLKAFRENRYDFAIMLFFLMGGYGQMPQDVFPVKFYDLGILASLAFAVLLRKPVPVRRMLVLYLLYVVALFWIATQSWESMSTQFIVMRGYFSFIIVFVFLGTFANHPFQIKEMVRRLMVFLIIVCVFYILDSLILKGYFFMPVCSWGGGVTISTVYFNPFSLSPTRIYPHGLLFIPIVMVPAMRMFRLPKWVWLLVVVSALTTFTFTYLTALTVTLLLFQGSLRRLAKIAGVAVVCGLLLFGIDCLLPTTTDEYNYTTSTLRIKSTIDQFVDLANAVDDEDIAEFGSGRMAQAIPKLELVELYHKEWIGLGFLHPQFTKSTRFIVDNEYYTDVTKSTEVSTGIEVIPLEIFVQAGWAGLIVMNVFLFGVWLTICRLRYNYIYLATLVFVLVMGVGGFSSPTRFIGAQLLALSYAMVILANRERPEETSSR